MAKIVSNYCLACGLFHTKKILLSLSDRGAFVGVANDCQKDTCGSSQRWHCVWAIRPLFAR